MFPLKNLARKGLMKLPGLEYRYSTFKWLLSGTDSRVASNYLEVTLKSLENISETIFRKYV